jgi:hypothetical protein
MKIKTLRTASIAMTLAVVAALPVRAGIYFEQEVTSEGQAHGMQMSVKGWAEGDKAKVVYEDSNNEIMPAGSYLLTVDGGKTVYLIRPADKTYSKWDMAEMFSFLSHLGEQMGGMMKIDFKDPHSKSLLTEPGGPVLGYSTTHYKWESGYTMDMKIAFMNRSDTMDTITDAWVTRDVSEPGLFAWLRATAPTTGDPELDQVLTENAKKIQDGIMLKMDQTTTTTDKKGKSRTSTTHFLVTKLVHQDVDDSNFVMPTGYKETPLIPEMDNMQGDQKDENAEEESEGPMKSLKGLFGKKKKN